MAGIQRVQYRERQVVTASDLALEQDYLISTRRRHNITAHSWGVVAGLGVEMQGDDLVVAPGFAVDGYGRELVLDQPAHVTAESLAAQDEGAGVAVWLRYVEEDDRRRGRTLEAAQVVPAPFYDGIDVRLYDLELVYLGRVDRGAHSVDGGRRPLAGLTGETVVAPTGDAAILLGETFSVLSAGNPAWQTDADGNSSVSGNASVDGEILLLVPDDPDNERGALVFTKPVARPAPSPWSIYHTAAPLVENGPLVEQLRIEIEDPEKKADPSTWVLAIGQATGGGAFQPCLSVTADCTVTVSGDLVIEGLILEGPVALDPDDPRLAQAVLDKWVGGITAGSAELDDVYAGGLEVTILATALAYTITVINGGTSPLSNVHVWDSISSGSTFLRSPRDLTPYSFSLAVGEQRDFSEDYPAGAAGAVTVSASVFGLAPSNRIVQKAASADTVIPQSSPH